MRPRNDPRQEELPLSSIASHTLFPGRTVLYVHEVAAALKCTIQHVINLCDQKKIQAVNISGEDPTNATKRRNYRIPVSAYDDFIARTKNQP